MEKNFTQEDILKMIEMIDAELQSIEKEHKQVDLDHITIRHIIMMEHQENKDGYIVVYPDSDSTIVKYAKFETKRDAEDFRKTQPSWSILKPVIDEELDCAIQDYQAKCDYFSKTKQTLHETRRIFCSKLDDDHIKLIDLYR